jgi:hypothetical protein
LFLLGHINHAAPAFANLLKQFVAANSVTGFFSGPLAGGIAWDCASLFTGWFNFRISCQTQLQQTPKTMISRRIGQQFRSAAGAFLQFGHDSNQLYIRF